MKRAIEVILHDEIQRIFDHFASIFDIHIVFFSIDGQELRSGLDRPPAPFCKLVQDRLLGRQRCIAMDETMCRKCTRHREPVRYACHAGVEEAVTPLVVQGQLAGYIMIGQYRTTDRLKPAVLAAARANTWEKETEQAFLALPYFNREKADHLLGLFAYLADYIVAREIVSVRGERMAGRIMAFVEERFRDRITVGDAARSVGQSVSAVSHHLKRVTGKTFVQHVRETRIRRAEQYLREAPEMTIQEIALQSGFTDPYYFSRVYRKHRGFPPGQYRKTEMG